MLPVERYVDVSVIEPDQAVVALCLVRMQMLLGYEAPSEPHAYGLGERNR